MPPHPQDYYTFVGDPYQQESFISHCHPGWVPHPRYIILLIHVDGAEIRRSPHHLGCKKQPSSIYLYRWWQLKDLVTFSPPIPWGFHMIQFDNIFFQNG